MVICGGVEAQELSCTPKAHIPTLLARRTSHNKICSSTMERRGTSMGMYGVQQQRPANWHGREKKMRHLFINRQKADGRWVRRYRGRFCPGILRVVHLWSLVRWWLAGTLHLLCSRVQRRKVKRQISHRFAANSSCWPLHWTLHCDTAQPTHTLTRNVK